MRYLSREEFLQSLKNDFNVEWTKRQLRSRVERKETPLIRKKDANGEHRFEYPETAEEISVFTRNFLSPNELPPQGTPSQDVKNQPGIKVQNSKPLDTYQHDSDSRYYSEIDENEGHVIAYMPFLRNGYIRVSCSVDEQIHRAYSSEGANMQIQKISQMLHWPPFILRGYLRARGLTHASHVWPEHQIERLSVDELVEDAIIAKAEKAKAVLDRREAKRIQRDAEIGRSYRELASYLTEITIPAIPAPPIPLVLSTKSKGSGRTESKPEFDVYFPMKDLHVGKRPFHAPLDFSLAIQEQGIKNSIDETIDSIIRTWGVPRRFILVTGDDQLNSNGSNQTTLKGTPLGSNSVGSFFEQAETLQRVKIYQIQACLNTGAQVYDHYIPSNHAPDAEFLIAKFCEAYFRNDSRVEFNTSHDTFKVVSCGSVPVFDTHGTHTTDATLPTIAARMVPPGTDFSKAVIFRGHTHAGARNLQRVDTDMNGVQLYVVPSSAAACGYEESHGWHFTRHAMAAYRISYTKGCDSWIQV